MKNQNSFRGKRLVKLIVPVAIIIIIITIGLFVYSNKSQDNSVSQQPQPIALVHITKKGFEPATLSVKPGTLIIWTNQDEKPHQVASNPYPKDDGLPGLKSELLNNNPTYQFKTDKTGTFGYHDELNPTINGSLVVGD